MLRSVCDQHLPLMLKGAEWRVEHTLTHLCVADPAAGSRSHFDASLCSQLPLWILIPLKKWPLPDLGFDFGIRFFPHIVLRLW